MDDPYKVQDNPFIILTILQENADNALLVIINNFIVTDEPFTFQNLRNVFFHLRCRYDQGFVTHHVGVTDPGQVICDWIGQDH